MQVLRDERDLAQAEVKELKKSLNSAKTDGASDVGGLRRESSDLKKRVGELTSQLLRAKNEMAEAKANEMKIISEEELIVRLRRATEDHREKIREKFDVVNVALTDFTLPEKLTHPYRCSVHYDLVEKSSGKPYQIDVQVRAPLSGKWEVPSTSELEKNVKEGHNSPMHVGNIAPATGQNAVAEQPAPASEELARETAGRTAYGQSSRNPSTVVLQNQPITRLPDGRIPSNRSEGTGGYTQQPFRRQPSAPRVQQLPPQQQPAAPSRPRPVGPGLGRIQRDIRVNW